MIEKKSNYIGFYILLVVFVVVVVFGVLLCVLGCFVVAVIANPKGMWTANTYIHVYEMRRKINNNNNNNSFVYF